MLFAFDKIRVVSGTCFLLYGKDSLDATRPGFFVTVRNRHPPHISSVFQFKE
jgi:hypothetical protein